MNLKKNPILLSFFVIISLLLIGCNGKLPGGDARKNPADPKKRVKWMGPDMSARSSITARLMETWSHSQALYDALGIIRENKDRIKNIVVLGNNTFKWCYALVTILY